MIKSIKYPNNSYADCMVKTYFGYRGINTMYYENGSFYIFNTAITILTDSKCSQNTMQFIQKFNFSETHWCETKDIVQLSNINNLHSILKFKLEEWKAREHLPHRGKQTPWHIEQGLSRLRTD